MRRNLAYLLYVLKHKWFVYRAGRHLKLSWWFLLLHDWSKFTREEWGPYARTFYDERGHKIPWPDTSTTEFRLAVHHHRRRNKHHPEYWVRPAGAYPFRMPDRYVIEMVADWAGAGRAKNGHWDIAEWVEENLPMIELNPVTLAQVKALVVVLEGKLS